VLVENTPERDCLEYPELDYFGLNPGRDEKELVNKLLARGVSHVVIKRGTRGASYYSELEEWNISGYQVPVIDPTGAGDCFGATFVSLFLAGYTPQAALEAANASGALAISQRGPMEGTSTLSEIEHFLQNHPR
jgi:sugar/nucleoside kinase (ribokinase family)